MAERLKVLLVGGTHTERQVVVRGLEPQRVCLVIAEADEAVARAKLIIPDAAIMLHPEAMSLVASVHGISPVVVVGPESEVLAETYLAAGVEDYLNDSEVRTQGYLQRTLHRAVARRSARRQLEHIASVDPLTGLLNRRGIEAKLNRIATRNDGPTVALLVDLDNFKEINTTRGLTGGDEVIRDVADLLNANARPTDIVGRLGGDEFLVVLPGADKISGRIIAERMRRAIEAQGVTASFGLASVDPTTNTIESLVLRTQNLLATSKSAGKNRLCSSSLLPPVVIADRH